MQMSAPVDGFRLAYDRVGSGPPVVLLHGWPGTRQDHADVAVRLRDRADVLVPDLRGFGDSDRRDDAEGAAYGAEGQGRSVLALLDELELDAAVLAGYDIGSRVAQWVAAHAPDRVRALVISPPISGAGERVLEPRSMAEFWYQRFHQLDLSDALVDGRPDALRTYLGHFWLHWSGPGFTPAPERFDALVAAYARPGAFRASLGWYRSGAGTVARALQEAEATPPPPIAAPTTLLWPAHDPLFPPAWADRRSTYFSDVELRELPDAGHFTPLEAPDAFAGAIAERL
jgi:pimeloyl-ACP methyl ester carboxylesterase